MTAFRTHDHSSNDTLNCWDGTTGGTVGNPCALAVFAAFKDLDSCSGDAKDILNGVCKSYDTCSAGTGIRVCKSNTGHGVYTATNIMVTDESWKFLKRFTKQ